jgi:hypothetical protein
VEIFIFFAVLCKNIPKRRNIISQSLAKAVTYSTDRKAPLLGMDYIGICKYCAPGGN